MACIVMQGVVNIFVEQEIPSEGGGKNTIAERPGTWTQDLSYARQESVTAHHSRNHNVWG